MAGIIAALVFGGASEGIDKIKSKRAERKARRRQDTISSTASTVQSSSSQTDIEDEIRGLQFAESKARAASEERQRASEENNDDDDQQHVHPALRVLRPHLSREEVEALAGPPPPYVQSREPPSYEEHVAGVQDVRARNRMSSCG